MTAPQKIARPSTANAGASSTGPNQQPAKTGSRSRGRNQQTGVMVKIRLLPPSLQEAEYLKLLPIEWHEGSSKVDYSWYTPGKVSGRPGKPSQGSVAYLHLGKEEDVMLLSDTVKQIVWEDAANSFNDPCLKARPYLERCAYRKNPAGKQRNDSLQGDIDQDPEFISFLESLTQTAPKDKDEDKSVILAAEVEKTTEKAKTTTPLIEFMREKREKDREGGGSGRGGRGARQEAKSSRSRGDEKKRSRDKDHDGKDKEKDRSNNMPEKVKILKKVSAPDGTNEASSGKSTSNTGTTEPTPAKSKKAEIAATARALQRDFSLGPGAAHRRARAEIMKAEANKLAMVNGSSGKKENTKEQVAPAGESSKSTDAQATGSKRDPARTRGRGKGKGSSETSKVQQVPVKPIILLKKNHETPAQTPTQTPTTIATPTMLVKPDVPPPISTAKSPAAEKHGVSTPLTPANGSSSKGKSSEKGNRERKSEKSSGKGSNAAATVAITPGATQAFVKHVSASQGINESSLRTALSTFGAINSIEIDRRKGFAYVEFSQHESLVAASRVSQIPIGQGHVQVVERRDKKPVAANGSTASPSNSGEKGKGADAKDTGKDGEKVAKADKTEKGERPERSEKGEKGDKGEKGEKSGSRRNRGRRGGGGKGNKDGGNTNGSGEKSGKRSGNQAAAGGSANVSSSA